MSVLKRTGSIDHGLTATPSKGSLNFVLKKREAARIDYENRKIAHRIMSQKPSISKKQFDDEYKKLTQNRGDNTLK